MRLRRRIFNIARAELNAALKRIPVGGAARKLDPKEQARLDEELERARREAEAHRGGRSGGQREDSEERLRRYYANLELPFGAGAAEVRAAYRRLMRRYHPDRHHGNEGATEVATELSQKLRDAHDGLLAHLEHGTR
ncbi:MAG: DnaJ domain-containing protein [Deltaproteobacteria bacterium]|nr:DnaJ domain-containing protein [Deltaproteobacteria bacterium]